MRQITVLFLELLTVPFLGRVEIQKAQYGLFLNC